MASSITSWVGEQFFNVALKRNEVLVMVRSLFERLTGKYRRVAAVRFGRRGLRMRNHEPLISFTFDDFPSSALFAGGRILAAYGFGGTYYTSIGLMGLVAPTGSIFQRAELDAVLEGGHEFGCHTYAHCDASLTDPAAFEESIVQNQRALKQLVPGAAMQSLSYPIGVPKPAIKRRSGAHYIGCRGGGQTHNAGIIDLNYLKAFFIEQAGDRPEYISAAIRAACEATGWLIFATHDVTEGHTRYGCTPALFEKIVRESAGSGARVVPVSEGLRVVGAC